MLFWILIVLAWLFFILGSIANLQIVWSLFKANKGQHTSSMVPLVPGLVGSLAVYFTLPQLSRWGYEASSPLLWIFLPLILDIGTLPYFVLACFGMIKQVVSSKEGIARVPFLRYSRQRPKIESAPFSKEPAITGCILGTAVGDAMGLACEGLSREKQMKMFPKLAGYKFLPFGKGMTSDDSEHTCMVAQSLIETTGYVNADAFAKKFASNFGWRLRFWLLGLPAGIGSATLRAILKLWIGFTARASGVFSGGNGPAMRVALIGVCYGADAPRLQALVRAATRVTHTDPRAEHGAMGIALAAHLAAQGQGPIDPQKYRELLAARMGSDAIELIKIVDEVIVSVVSGEPASVYAERIGCGNGITGYIYHTVPIALHVWLRHHSDYREAVLKTVRLGGDTDTVAAIVGALVGARVGVEGIPSEWLRDLWEWPRTKEWMKRLGTRLAEHVDQETCGGNLPLNPLKLFLRNIIFLSIVLAHGFRRLLVRS